jgi:hypothetical protein
MRRLACVIGLCAVGAFAPAAAGAATTPPAFAGALQVPMRAAAPSDDIGPTDVVAGQALPVPLTTLDLVTVLRAAPRAHVACSRDTPATIHGAHKCLGAGEYCATRYEREYERYGFVCSSRYRPPRLRRK